MSVSLVVIRLELAGHSPVPADFGFSAAGESAASRRVGGSAARGLPGASARRPSRRFRCGTRGLRDALRLFQTGKQAGGEMICLKLGVSGWKQGFEPSWARESDIFPRGRRLP